MKDNFENDSENVLKQQNKIKFEINEFNKIFEDANNSQKNRGYGDFLKKDNHVNNSVESIIKYKIPESYNNSNYGCNLLVGEDVDFSDQGLYCDLKKAYGSDNKELNIDNIDNLYKRNLESLETERNDLDMTDIDYNEYNKYQNYINEKEKNFHDKLRQNDKCITNNYTILNKKLLNYSHN